MSQRTLRGHRHLSIVMPMRGRDPREADRTATPLELFFDLVSVVAVALAAERLVLAAMVAMKVAWRIRGGSPRPQPAAPPPTDAPAPS